MTDPTTQERGTQAAAGPPVARPAPTGSADRGAIESRLEHSHTIGSDAPAADSRPVSDQHRAVIAVFPDLGSAERAVEELAEHGFPVDRISLVGKDMESELRINGFVTTGDVAGPSAATGAWVGGLLGVLSGAAMLFVPGAGPLVVLGPLAGAAVGAAEGALVGGAVGAVLGHFVAKRHLPKYEALVRTGNYLLVVHGTEEEVSRAQRLLTDIGSVDVQRHDEHRGSIDQIGPIDKVYEGMRVVDAEGREVGRVEFVKLGDPAAASVQGQDLDLMPKVPRPFATRLLRIGYVKVDRKGLFARDAYVAATDIDRVDDNTVYLDVTNDMLLTEWS